LTDQIPLFWDRMSIRL